ncbi:MAG: thermonuclease family protein [Campylobacter sp.]|nr:thermonuclease family protein [Campylobacter sp.]
MKKFVFLFFAISLGVTFGASNDKNLQKVMQFTKFFDDRYFAFKINPIREITCEFSDLSVISIQNKPSCISDKKELEKFEKEHKSAVERILQPGRNYFIKINSSKSKDYFGCDISTDKKNFRLVLVKEGFAVPSKNAHKLLHEAYEDAVKNKKGMFSAKFESVTECILGEIPNFGDKKEEIKEEPKVQTPQTPQKSENKIKIEIN